MAKLYPQAEISKHVLSSMGSAHIFIESLMDGIDFSHNLSRARFENLLFNQLDALKKPVADLLEKTGFQGRIGKIILCGGGMKIPKFQSTIQSMFPEAELLNSINPYEVIALGCAKQAALLSKQWDPDCKYFDMEVDLLPCDIVVKVGETEAAVVKTGTIVPIESTFKLENAEEKTHFEIFERQNESLVKVGEIVLDNLKTDDDIYLKISSDGVQIQMEAFE